MALARLAAGALEPDQRAETLVRLAEGVGVRLTGEQAEQLWRHVDLLLKWNERINLTSIVDLEDVLELHLLDSLALAPLLSRGPVLDAGSGGGFPGIPLHVARPELEVWLVDSVQKKVAFLKTVTARLALKGVRSRAVRLGGAPDSERLPLFSSVVSRALLGPAEWISLAERYLAPGGSVFCLLGANRDVPSPAGRLKLARSRSFTLPLSGARRTILELRRGEECSTWNIG
jgi:16S rRNA (guanine527-N7)-methyltransferase